MWFVRPKYSQPEQEVEEEEMSMMFVPPQKVGVIDGLHVWDFVEGFNQLAMFSEVHCWLNIYNESREAATVQVFTAPSSGIQTIQLAGWRRKSVNLGQLMKDKGIKEGFTTVVKSKSPNVVSGISIFGK